MDYQKIYDLLIEGTYEKSEYMEKHHIIPKCMGGNNNKENIVQIPYRIHFLCHWLLCKIHKDNYKLKAAFAKMLETTSTKNRNITSKQFEIVKRTLKDTHYPWLKESNKNGPWNKGKKGVQVAWNKGLKIGPQTKSSNNKRSETLKNYYSIEEHPRSGKDPWNKGKKGVQVAWNKGINEKRIICPNCGKDANPGNYSRWHGNNCKKKI